jgi:cyclophilin family peptidyl-prolyl cis-trans isomerase
MFNLFTKMKRILSLSIILLAFVSFSYADKKEKKAKKEKNTYVEMQTTMGTMVLKLYNETPLHRDNFIKIVKAKQYDSVLFHRVISAFMIQGGDPTSKNAGPGVSLGSGDIPGVPRIAAEFNPALYHKKGALAAARDGNPEKASSNCQFYIVVGKKFVDADLDRMQSYNGWKYTNEQREVYKNIGGTPHLDNNYTVYGELVSGMEVLDAIAAAKTAPGDRPLVDVRILKTKLLKKYKVKKEKKKNVEPVNSPKKEKNILQSESQSASDTEEEEKTSTKKRKN